MEFNNNYPIIYHINTTFNQQIKKHKTSNVLVIIDNFNVTVSTISSTGSTHDAVILNHQLDNLTKMKTKIHFL